MCPFRAGGHGFMVMFTQTIAPISADYVRELIGAPSPTIVEVGAHEGLDTAEFLKVMPGARIICFEPDPRPRERFVCRNDPRVTLFPVAIADKPGREAFHQSTGAHPRFDLMANHGDPRDWDLSGSLARPSGHLERHPWCEFDKTIEVDVQPLDHYQADYFPSVDCLWADVQGLEARLIAGAQETLRHTRFFITEYSNTPMYEGQPTLTDIELLLPDLELIEVFPWDAVFANTSNAA